MNIKTLMFCFGALATVAEAQTVRRVNPDPSVTGTNVYSTIQAAHNAAAAGDILIIEPGSAAFSGNQNDTRNSVGNLDCIKRLTIYGSGYYKEHQPAYQNLPDRAYSSTVGTIKFASGSDGSILQGVVAYYITIQVSNVTVQGCLINNGISIDASFANIRGLNIQRNFLASSIIQFTRSGASTFNIQGFEIKNCSINSTSLSVFGTTGPIPTIMGEIVFNQNTFENFPATSIQGTKFTNNIFTSNSPLNAPTGSDQFRNVTFTNNVFAGLYNFDISANTSNKPLTYISNSLNPSPDAKYMLANPDAANFSNTGGQVGMFGGTTPYVVGGLPVGPTVTAISNSGVGNSTTPIVIKVSAKSNN